MITLAGKRMEWWMNGHNNGFTTNQQSWSAMLQQIRQDLTNLRDKVNSRCRSMWRSELLPWQVMGSDNITLLFCCNEHLLSPENPFLCTRSPDSKNISLNTTPGVSDVRVETWKATMILRFIHAWNLHVWPANCDRLLILGTRGDNFFRQKVHLVPLHFCYFPS